jgi:hypothetical protein
MEDLLIEIQIKSILIEAKKDCYQNIWYLNPGKTPSCVIKISNKKNLILIRGNQDTGHQHIQFRHSYTSMDKWINGKPDKPSKFKVGSNFSHILTISEEIFSESNKKNDKNKNPHLFDVYEGTYKHEDNKSIKYRLVLYRNTKIIHTVFPIRSKFNRKIVKHFPFIRSQLSTRYKAMNAEREYYFDFLDEFENIRYKSTTTYDEYRKSIKMYVTDMSSNLTYLVYESTFEEVLEFGLQMINESIKDTKIIERAILNIETNQDNNYKIVSLK